MGTFTEGRVLMSDRDLAGPVGEMVAVQIDGAVVLPLDGDVWIDADEDEWSAVQMGEEVCLRLLDGRGQVVGSASLREWRYVQGEYGPLKLKSRRDV